MDFYFANHGSITVLTALTEAAQEWVMEHLPDDVLTMGSGGYVIEPRYAGAILQGLQDDGLTVGS